MPSSGLAALHNFNCCPFPLDKMCQLDATEIVEIYQKKWVVKYATSNYPTISQAAQAQRQVACATRCSQLSFNMADMSVVGVVHDDLGAGAVVTPGGRGGEGGAG